MTVLGAQFCQYHLSFYSCPLTKGALTVLTQNLLHWCMPRHPQVSWVKTSGQKGSTGSTGAMAEEADDSNDWGAAVSLLNILRMTKLSDIS